MVPVTQSAFIFSAFAHDYGDHPGGKLPFFEQQFNLLMEAASHLGDSPFAGLRYAAMKAPEDELATQYLTYLYSCAASRTLRSLQFTPAFTAGYSMGIYAALFDAGVITFETGLELIRLAFEAVSGQLKNRQFGMATVIGLDRRDIAQLIHQQGLEVEIANRNAPHSFVVSGQSDHLVRFMEDARNEGALHVRDLEVSIPYHSRFLSLAAPEFDAKISHLKFSPAQTPILSLVDQVIVTSQVSLRSEVSRNLFRSLDWLATTEKLLALNTELFVECGPSKGLTKNAKFIDGNFCFASLDTLEIT